MSDDEDNLDDLFGAFDGDIGDDDDEEEQGVASSAHDDDDDDDDDDNQLKKDHEQEEESPSAKTHLNKKLKKGEEGNEDALKTGSKSSPVKEDKSNDDDDDENETLVTAKDSSNEQQQQSSSTTSTKQQQEQEDREIATGTAHDKSIRSYTAHPDPTALSNLQESNESIDYSSLPPAKTYPFKLDPFQETSTKYIAKNQSVLVAAHTSAGKTVVAEYAIAQSLKHHQRVIYTSPIKALSNQKYRDLSEEFGADNVGLMTGDITINPNAICLVMTTEILRSMLYRGSEVMREVAWVIYDEVHYMRDKERGVVWEESIILLPHKVRFVFLSATIPNARQFVQWIAKIHHQICHVVYTNYRPTPLQHYIFAAGGDGLNLVVDEKGKFREKNFQKAMAALQGTDGGMDAAIADAIGQSGGSGGGNKRNKRKRGSTGGGKNGHTDLHRIVKLIMERNLNPVIIFSFSKKDCERYALELNREDYTDEVEKDLISQVYQNAIESLSEDDRLLPQVEALLPLLKRGIGIHHGGLLPILKEIVEILFSEGLIKALFATETFVSRVCALIIMTFGF